MAPAPIRPALSLVDLLSPQRGRTPGTPEPTPGSRTRRVSLGAVGLASAALAAGVLVAPTEASAAPVATPALRANTTAVSTTTATTATTTPSSAVAAAKAAKAAKATAVIRTAASLKGKPYRYGATGPSAFDCSGYSRYVFARNGISLPRTSSQQYRATHRVSKSQAKPGDLVFFGKGSRVYHVGIYAGNGKMWHSPRPGKRVQLVKIWTSNWSAGRVI